MTGRAASEPIRRLDGARRGAGLSRCRRHPPDPRLQAAVLAHGIAEGQIFVDGNKRTALDAMCLFLDLNDVVISTSQPELAQWMLDLAGELSPEGLAQRIRDALSHSEAP